jgi:hypothetical protein
MISAPQAHPQRWANAPAHMARNLLLAMAAYGVAAGAIISMYWNLPALVSMQGVLGTILGVGYLVVVLLGLPNIGLGGWYCLRGAWAQGITRLLLFFVPLIILLGAEGLIAHVLWWSPISHTGQFHMRCAAEPAVRVVFPPLCRPHHRRAARASVDVASLDVGHDDCGDDCADAAAGGHWRIDVRAWLIKKAR